MVRFTKRGEQLIIVGAVGFSITSNSCSSLHGRRGRNRRTVVLLARLRGYSREEWRRDRAVHPKYVRSHNSVDGSRHSRVMYILFFKSTACTDERDYKVKVPQRSNDPSMGTVQGRAGENLVLSTGF